MQSDQGGIATVIGVMSRLGTMEAMQTQTCIPTRGELDGEPGELPDASLPSRRKELLILTLRPALPGRPQLSESAREAPGPAGWGTAMQH